MRLPIARWLRLTVMTVALLAGCTCEQSGSTGQGKRDPGRSKTLVVQLESEPAHLVTMLKPDAWAHRMINHNVLEGLIRIDPRSNRFVGELAERWTIDEAGSTYTFHLREGVRWHDGKPFSAADVRFTFERLVDEQVEAESTRASLIPFIERFETPSANSFRISCKQPSVFFLQALASLMVLPAHRMREGDVNRHPLLRAPIGTGPYRFVRWESGKRIVFERFRDYWGRKPAIERVVWLLVQSPDLALKLARRGEIDFIPRLRPAQWERYRDDAQLRRDFALVEHVSPGTGFVLFNHRRAPFDEVAVRRALAQLLDLETITKRILGGLYDRAASLYWRNDPYYDEQTRPLAFDPAAARRSLAKAGFADRDRDGTLERGGRPLTLTFLVPAASKSAQQWLTVYQQELRRAGVRMNILSLEWATFLQRVREHNFDMAALGIQLSGPYTDLYLQLHSSQAAEGQNYAGYHDEQVDRLLVQIREEADEAKRRSLSLALQRRLVHEIPVIPLFSLKEPGLVARRVRGVYASDVWYQLRDWRLE